MVDRPAIAERTDGAQQSLRRLVETVIIAARHGQAVFRHYDIPDFQHSTAAIGFNPAHLYPADTGRGIAGSDLVIARRHDGYKHPVNIMRIDPLRLARQHEAAVQTGKIKPDL